MSAQKGEVLCIHYYFPPLKSTAVIRNYHIASTFAVFFKQVHVLTSSNHVRFPNEDRTLPENIHLYDIPTIDYRWLVSGKSKKDAHISSGKKMGKSSQYLLKIQKSFPFNLFLAEGNLLYIFNAYRKAKTLIQGGNITTIYSSFGPYADHYVGFLLKKKFPGLRWIADFRDLQIEPIYKNVIWKGLQQKMEQYVLARADLITCVSQGFVEQLKIYDRPTKAVLRGIELREPERQYEKFTISYTGSLYFEFRDPRPVFKTIKDLITEGQMHPEEIRILYAGRDDEKYANWIIENELSECFINKKLVSQIEAKSIQNKSHINLLLTSSSPNLTGVITGKIFEYFEALNPTLCLISGVYDPEFESLFKELNAGVVVYSPERSPGKMREFILSKYKEWKATHRVESHLNSQIIEKKYGWKHQVEEML
ncbi:MAG: hypothetical protein AAGA77_00500 [Bacteroidota bacterium]